MPKVKDRYEFILELLETSKLTPAQKERVMLLSANVIKESSKKEDDIIKRIEEIEAKIRGEKDDEPQPPTKVNMPKYRNPIDVYRFLFEFNQDPILRSTCHEIDSNALGVIIELCGTTLYDFQIHYEKILSAFVEHDKRFAPSSIKALIRGYLTGKDYKGDELKSGWSSNHIRVYWSDAKLILWATKYSNLAPNSIKSELDKNKTRGFELAENSFVSQLTGKKVQTFRELVLYFKSLFHMHFGENSLYNYIIHTNKSKKWNDNIDFEINESIFPKNIELFTDVDKLLQSYIKIIELIIEQHPKESKPKVKLSFNENGNNVYLSIHHINNTYNKTIQNTIDRLGQTYTNLIIKQINGLCNLYLRADFGNEGYAVINLWDGKNRKVNTEGLDGFKGGVEHILEFKK